MKLTAIVTGIGLFFAKTWKIIKALKDLKQIKKEVTEAYEETIQVWELLEKSYLEIKSFRTKESDGGEKITISEYEKAFKSIEEIIKESKEAYVEVFEAKKLISDSIKKIKGQ